MRENTDQFVFFAVFMWLSRFGFEPKPMAVAGGRFACAFVHLGGDFCDVHVRLVAAWLARSRRTIHGSLPGRH